jgi:hypothetical protein
MFGRDAASASIGSRLAVSEPWFASERHGSVSVITSPPQHGFCLSISMPSSQGPATVYLTIPQSSLDYRDERLRHSTSSELATATRCNGTTTCLFLTCRSCRALKRSGYFGLFACFGPKGPNGSLLCFEKGGRGVEVERRPPRLAPFGAF